MWVAGVWCVLLLLGGVVCAPAPGDLLPADSLHHIGEPVGAVSEGGGAGWRFSSDTAPFIFDDLPRYQRFDALRWKRKMPSLSISNPMEVLRQRLVLEIARKQLRENAARQAEENRLFLQNVGKRGIWAEGVLNSIREEN